MKYDSQRQRCIQAFYRGVLYGVCAMPCTYFIENVHWYYHVHIAKLVHGSCTATGSSPTYLSEAALPQGIEG
jgi:hypothetical protein